MKFPGYAGHKELDELIAHVKTLPGVPEAFIGMGGGQTMDLNKAMAAHYRKNRVSFATALTTDAPTFTHAMINNPGTRNEIMFHYKNPDYVVVDTEITIQSPPWMLASGIGDALATYIEARASFANNNVCNSGQDDYRPALLGLTTTKLCYDILLKDGAAAMRAARNHLRTPAYENVVEATTLLSGVGCCVLARLIVENDERFPQIFEFNKAVGLPVRAADLEIPADQRDQLIDTLVDGVYGKRWNVINEPFFFEKSTLTNAIKYLDAYAEEHK